ncbi:MAG: class I SAM-dependent methyltransferase [Candidatus Bathyarchaeota archaeon]|nr:MAG: class I SAM-dependent methyltransferase [Candidatus Bathyarchaeota archaeon]
MERMKGKERSRRQRLGYTDLPVDTVTITSLITSIREDYERVNHFISFFQDQRARLMGLRRLGVNPGVGLEMGSGPGNFTRIFRPLVEGLLVCLDYSDTMLAYSRRRTEDPGIGYVRGVFEALPLRSGSVNSVATAYALRDSTDKSRTIAEIDDVLRERGRLLIIDVGRPSNPIVEGFLALYMRYLVPVIGGLVAGHGYMNPWSYLYKTYGTLPVNNTLLRILEHVFDEAELFELSFGGLVVALAEKRKGKKWKDTVLTGQ